MLRSLPLGGPAHFHVIVVGVGSQDDARIPATPNARRDAALVRRLLLDSSVVLPEDMLLLTDGGTAGAGAPLRPGQGGIVLTMPPSRVLVACATGVQIWDCSGAPRHVSAVIPSPDGNTVDDCIVAAAVSADDFRLAVATERGWLMVGLTTDDSWIAPPARIDDFPPVSLSLRVDSMVLAMEACAVRFSALADTTGTDGNSPAPIYVQLGAAGESKPVDVCFSGGRLLATLDDRLLVLDGSSLAPLHSHIIPRNCAGLSRHRGSA